MRCALYARVSTTDQNCEMQLRELRDYIARREWKNGGEYIDTGFSGSKASRPALDRLMADAAQRKFDCIVVYKIDRFGRSDLHLNQQLAALTSYGVRFIATSQSLDTDERNLTSRLLLQILASVAEFEREMIRERTLSGMKAAQAAGMLFVRPNCVLRWSGFISWPGTQRHSAHCGPQTPYCRSVQTQSHPDSRHRLTSPIHGRESSQENSHGCKWRLTGTLQQFAVSERRILLQRPCP